MLRSSLIVAAALATLATPALAASGWNVILNAPADANSLGDQHICIVVARPAARGEERIAGPFRSEAAGAAAMKSYPACKAPSY